MREAFNTPIGSTALVWTFKDEWKRMAHTFYLLIHLQLFSLLKATVVYVCQNILLVSIKPSAS